MDLKSNRSLRVWSDGRWCTTTVLSYLVKQSRNAQNREANKSTHNTQQPRKRTPQTAIFRENAHFAHARFLSTRNDGACLLRSLQHCYLSTARCFRAHLCNYHAAARKGFLSKWKNYQAFFVWSRWCVFTLPILFFFWLPTVSKIASFIGGSRVEGFYGSQLSDMNSMIPKHLSIHNARLTILRCTVACRS